MVGRDYISERPGPSAILLGGGLVLVIGSLDYLTGREISLAFFYLFPIALVTWYMKRLDGFCVCFITAMVWLAVESKMDHFYAQPPFVYWNTVLRLVYLSLVVTLLSGIKIAFSENSKIIDDIQVALAKINTLRSATPICAWCQKVRDSQGSWLSFETYMQDNSLIEVTHGICPECLHSREGKKT
jgi:hypothetical protein